MKKEKIIKKNGFTLLEILIALGVFSVVMTIVVSSFVMVLKASRRNAAMQIIQGDAKYITEKIFRELRMSRIDPTVTEGEHDSIRIIHNDPAVGGITYEFKPGPFNFIREMDGASNGTRMNSNKVDVVGKFFVKKSTDGTGAIPIQERITLFMTLGLDDDGDGTWDYSSSFQTTMSTRFYE